MKSLTVIPFDFNGNDIRTILDKQGEPWFVAKDVAEALEYEIQGGIGKYIAHIPDEWKGGKPISTLRGVQELLCLSEPGLYFFVCRSDKPKALPFQRWLAGDVVPSIRKTGQYNRMINQFLLAEPRDWERRFPPEYYQALCGLFGWTYTDHTALPDVIGQITRRWVYGVCLPIEVLEELDARRGSQKLHQWVNADAGKRLFAQIDAVTLIAKQSIDYKDFDARCKFLWGKKGHQLSFLFPMAAPLGRRN